MSDCYGAPKGWTRLISTIHFSFGSLTLAALWFYDNPHSSQVRRRWRHGVAFIEQAHRKYEPNGAPDGTRTHSLCLEGTYAAIEHYRRIRGFRPGCIEIITAICYYCVVRFCRTPSQIN